MQPQVMSHHSIPHTADSDRGCQEQSATTESHVAKDIKPTNYLSTYLTMVSTLLELALSTSVHTTTRLYFNLCNYGTCIGIAKCNLTHPPKGGNADIPTGSGQHKSAHQTNNMASPSTSVIRDGQCVWDTAECSP